MEELEKLGPMIYLAYPIKIGYKYLKEKALCCKRKKPDNDNQTTEKKTEKKEEKNINRT